VASGYAIAVGGTPVSTVEDNGVSKWNLVKSSHMNMGLLFSLIKECTS